MTPSAIHFRSICSAPHGLSIHHTKGNRKQDRGLGMP